ncbi:MULTISPECIES: ABC transporter ATP-binding protein [Delftia]|uniref:dipeptide ABC transporter ATP-binding protein n=1 Tax=Delftia TaxID=80865 RepID=UPI0009282EDD|nr:MULTISPECIES: ABC transporter ATP-binding protein [Delftia]KAF1054225.1 MAG: putative ABC transporter ATP-binding protein [Delftia tsuruhatensis]MDH0417989.1 ABC transporter ATP-binding protein [Delftia tsuruhatensis]OJX13383.1 MAG: ABC transporter ATP-binding protein [Delftia sp. 67-8]QFS68012.1 dipeptide ABC transporter ATP-binding protein [Delftia tsuruhatensis]WON89666.1 ABC transporter ATP-binding protein [Delftia sp. UGAL515B_04]
MSAAIEERIHATPAVATTAPVLEVQDLAVAYRDAAGQAQRVVHGVSFSVAPGEVVALVGESGSGKTTTAQAVIGLLADNGHREHGSIRLQGTEVSGWPAARWNAIRGRVVSLVPQDPTMSLNPVRTVGDQVGEILRIHGLRDRTAVQARVLELLARVGLSQPALRARQYPHELSGGMRQRVLIAIAIALRPALIIADEPTSALDVTVQRRILDLIDALRRETGTAVLLVTHDLGVAADRSHRLVVMQGGRIQEQGPTLELLRNPQSAYTRRLLADAPSLAPAPRRTPRPATTDDWAIEVEDLVHEFAAPGHASAHGRGIFRAVDGVSLRVRRGSTHAIVGESGSGKTTTIRAIVGLGRPTAGRIRIEGTEVTGLRGEALRQLRRRVQLVYQNPFSSLDPRQSVFDIIEEPLLNFDPLPADERRRRVHDMLERVGLPAAVLQRRPHALSGGQRQRVAIARALVLQPQVLVLDEAVSALDVTVQAQILALLAQLQQDLGLTYLFISHDLAVVRQIADTVSVLRAGRVVDAGSVEEVFQRPTSDYTRELMDAIPGKRSIDFVPHPA